MDPFDVHLEDDEGMLADKALDREAWGLRELTREQFYAAWDAA